MEQCNLTEALISCLKEPLSAFRLQKVNKYKNIFTEYKNVHAEDIFKMLINEKIWIHEIIVCDMPCKFYFDIESYDTSNEKLFLETLFQLLEFTQNLLKEKFNHVNTKVNIMKSNQEDKLSYHIVFPNVWFQKAFMHYLFIHEFFPENFKKFIDLKVYAKTSFKTLRFVLTHKIDAKTQEFIGCMKPYSFLDHFELEINDLNDFYEYTITGNPPTNKNDSRYLRYDYPEEMFLSMHDDVNKFQQKDSIFSLCPEYLRNIINITRKLLHFRYKTGVINLLDVNYNFGGFRFTVSKPGLYCPIVQRLHRSNLMFIGVFIYLGKFQINCYCHKCIHWVPFLDELTFTGYVTHELKKIYSQSDHKIEKYNGDLFYENVEAANHHHHDQTKHQLASSQNSLTPQYNNDPDKPKLQKE
jgi:hypothetical protein